MELKTGIRCIDRILQGGFKFGELTVFASHQQVEPTVAPELKEAFDTWPSWANYCLHFNHDGEDECMFFRNANELFFWKQLFEMYRQTKGEETFIHALYMWDGGPTEIVDLEPHFIRIRKNIH